MPLLYLLVLLVCPAVYVGAQPVTIADIPLPDAYVRVPLAENSFGAYLRSLPLRTDDHTVYLFDGSIKANQAAHVAVVDLPIGNKDLHQCADACMRLWAEYLYKQQRYNDIYFNFLSDGKPRYYTEYAGADRSYTRFWKYMEYVFSYANTRSLYGQLRSVAANSLQPGDMIIQMGNPFGHAVMVADMAEHTETCETIFLLVQSYMPAQETHVLKNPNSPSLSPWYSGHIAKQLQTAEYFFGNAANDVKRFE